MTKNMQFLPKRIASKEIISTFKKRNHIFVKFKTVSKKRNPEMPERVGFLPIQINDIWINNQQ